jgi:hypothetical protein
MSEDNNSFHAMHDLGGTEAGAFKPTEHEPSDFDRRVDALVNLLAAKNVGLITPDERRRGIEELSHGEYHSLTYYQRWLSGVTNMLVEKGHLSRDEINLRIRSLRQG